MFHHHTVKNVASDVWTEPLMFQCMEYNLYWNIIMLWNIKDDMIMTFAFCLTVPSVGAAVPQADVGWPLRFKGESGAS